MFITLYYQLYFKLLWNYSLSSYNHKAIISCTLGNELTMITISSTLTSCYVGSKDQAEPIPPGHSTRSIYITRSAAFYVNMNIEHASKKHVWILRQGQVQVDIVKQITWKRMHCPYIHSLAGMILICEQPPPNSPFRCILYWYKGRPRYLTLHCLECWFSMLIWLFVRLLNIFRISLAMCQIFRSHAKVIRICFIEWRFHNYSRISIKACLNLTRTYPGYI